MHRVELKALIKHKHYPSPALLFLMHRVELKGWIHLPAGSLQDEFLMHRVELKASQASALISRALRVPNAPCGVESVIKVYDVPVGNGSS